MARTTDEIIQQMDQYLNQSVPELMPINVNPSASSVWQYLKRIFAFWTRGLELSYDAFKAETEAFVKTYRPYTSAWYVARAKAFQYGDAVITTATDVVYQTIDTSKQIIAECSVEEVSQPNVDLVLKVVKRDAETKALLPLNVNEIAAFNSYFRQIKPAGVRSVVRSDPPNPIDIRLSVALQGSVFDADGQVLGTGGRPVERATREFFQTMPFNSIFYLHDLESYIMRTVPGVISVEVNFVAFYDTAGQLIPVGTRIIPPSGYMEPPNALLNTYELV